jgi:hypothetical protein
MQKGGSLRGLMNATGEEITPFWEGGRKQQ